MTDVLWHWVLPLALVGMGAVYLIFRLPGQRWPRPLAVTAGGAIVSVSWGDTSALGPILITGVILTIGTAASARK